MKTNKSMSLLVGILVLSLLLGACAPAATQAAPAGAAPFKLNVGIGPYISNSVLMLAQKQGYFAEQNLDVTFTSFQNTNDLVALLAAGKLDVAAPALNAAFFNAISKGSNIKMILPLTDFVVKSCSISAYMARSADIKSGIYANKSDWAKAKIMVSNQGLAGIGGYLFSKVMANSGVSIDAINMQTVDTAAQEDALRKGQIDILYSVEPAITRMLAKGDLGILDTSEKYLPGFTSSTIVIGKTVLDNPDVAKRFSIAYLKAVRQFLKGSADDVNSATASELTKLPVDLVKKVCWPSISPDGIVNVQSLMEYQNWLIERKLLTQIVPADKFYDPSFAAAAVQVLGPQKP